MTTVTTEEYYSMLKAPAKRSKYGNKRVTRDGITFDSIKELNRYVALSLLQKAGKISGLNIHPKYELESAFVDIHGTKRRAEYYEGDFEYVEQGKIVVEDIKGGKATRTRLFESKRKRFIRRYPNHELRIVA